MGSKSATTRKVGSLLEFGGEQSREDLNKAHAEYVKWLGIHGNILRQKSKVKWFQEGDYNSNYFHSVLRDRRRRLHKYRIKNHRDRWVQSDDKIVKAAVKHFEKHFNLQAPTMNNAMLNCIPNIISTKENDYLTVVPDINEIREAVFFNLSQHSAAGPGGFNGFFFLDLF